MTPKDFINSLIKNKTLSIYEFTFTLTDNNIIVKNELTGKEEKYKSAAECYFVYQYTLKQTDKNRIHNRRSKKIEGLDFGGKDPNNIEYRKEYGFKY